MITLQSDASGQDWDATDTNSSCGGRWNEEELRLGQKYGIDYLEMLAAFHALRTYCGNDHDMHVGLQLDNTTAVTYVNHMGGCRSLSCDTLAKSIWAWCIDRRIWVLATHLPGRYIVEAGTRSRKFNERTEWMLTQAVFKNILAYSTMVPIVARTTEGSSYDCSQT